MHNNGRKSGEGARGARMLEDEEDEASGGGIGATEDCKLGLLLRRRQVGWRDHPILSMSYWLFPISSRSVSPTHHDSNNHARACHGFRSLLVLRIVGDVRGSKELSERRHYVHGRWEASVAGFEECLYIGHKDFCSKR